MPNRFAHIVTATASEAVVQHPAAVTAAYEAEALTSALEGAHHQLLAAFYASKDFADALLVEGVPSVEVDGLQRHYLMTATAALVRKAIGAVVGIELGDPAAQLG